MQIHGPDERTRVDGAKFLSHINPRPDRYRGEIWSASDTIRWKYWRSEKRVRRTLQNPFGKRDFVIAQPATNDELVVRRSCFLPPIFNILNRDGAAVGTIRLTSILRNRYTIAIHGEGTWTFRIVLFSVRCYAVANGTPVLWIAVGPSKRHWNVLVKPGAREWPLLAAIAFIHTEWWNYG